MISINLYEIVFQIINFLLLLYLLNRFLTKPLSEFLENRKQTIKKNLEKAENNRQEADQILAEQKEMLKQAHQDSKEIRQKAEAAAKEELDGVLDKAKEESKSMIDAAKKEIELDYKRAAQSLKDMTATLSVKISEKILQKEISASDNAQIIEDLTSQGSPAEELATKN